MGIWVRFVSLHISLATSNDTHFFASQVFWSIRPGMLNGVPSSESHRWPLVWLGCISSEGLPGEASASQLICVIGRFICLQPRGPHSRLSWRPPSCLSSHLQFPTTTTVSSVHSTAVCPSSPAGKSFSPVCQDGVLHNKCQFWERHPVPFAIFQWLEASHMFCPCSRARVVLGRNRSRGHLRVLAAFCSLPGDRTLMLVCGLRENNSTSPRTWSAVYFMVVPQRVGSRIAGCVALG